MNPQVPQPSNSQPIKKDNQKLALWLMLGPTALLITTFLVFILVDGAFSGTGTPDPDSANLFAETNPLTAALNIILMITGVVSFIAWLPAMITGIVLLAVRK